MQIFVSKCCSSLKGSRAPWRNGWFHMFGTGKIEDMPRILFFVKQKKNSETKAIMSEGCELPLIKFRTIWTSKRISTVIGYNMLNKIKWSYNEKMEKNRKALYILIWRMSSLHCTWSDRFGKITILQPLM